MQVYLYFTEDNVEQMLPELSSYEQEKLSTVTSQKRKNEFIRSRFLLRKIFLEQFNLELPARLQTSENGKPFIAGFPEFSLSHSKNAIAIVIGAKDPVGIDIESVSTEKDILALAKSFGTKAEYDYLCSQQDSEKPYEFSKIWTLKESFAKTYAQGLGKHLQQLQFDFANHKIINTPNKEKCFFSHTRSGDFAISVCVQGEANANTQVSIQFNLVELVANKLIIKVMSDLKIETYHQ